MHECVRHTCVQHTECEAFTSCTCLISRFDRNGGFAFSPPSFLLPLPPTHPPTHPPSSSQGARALVGPWNLEVRASLLPHLGGCPRLDGGRKTNTYCLEHAKKIGRMSAGGRKKGEEGREEGGADVGTRNLCSPGTLLPWDRGVLGIGRRRRRAGKRGGKNPPLCDPRCHEGAKPTI